MNYQLRLNGVFSRGDLPRKKLGVYVINLDDKQSKGTHWFPLFIVTNTTVYFNSSRIEYIPQDVLNEIND